MRAMPMIKIFQRSSYTNATCILFTLITSKIIWKKNTNCFFNRFVMTQDAFDNQNSNEHENSKIK